MLLKKPKPVERRKHRKSTRTTLMGLPLTPMVDMFAILVIFLLSNQQSLVEWIEFDHSISLPRVKQDTDTISALPKIELTRDHIFFHEKKFEMASETSTELLKKELKEHLKAEGINVLADEKIPFGTLKKWIKEAQILGVKEATLGVWVNR